MNDIEIITNNGELFLQEFLEMRNSQDGVNRPEIFEIDKTKTIDKLSTDVEEVALYLKMLNKLMPMREQLSAIGKKLEKEGKVKMHIGDNYSEVALDYYSKNVLE
jgi:hypothetical protein